MFVHNHADENDGIIFLSWFNVWSCVNIMSHFTKNYYQKMIVIFSHQQVIINAENIGQKVPKNMRKPSIYI